MRELNWALIVPTAAAEVRPATALMVGGSMCAKATVRDPGGPDDGLEF